MIQLIYIMLDHTNYSQALCKHVVSKYLELYYKLKQTKYSNIE